MIMQHALSDHKTACDAYARGQADGATGKYSPPNCVTDPQDYDAYVRGWNDAWAVSEQVSWWRRSSKNAPVTVAASDVGIQSATPTIVRVVIRDYPEERRYAVAREYGSTMTVYDEKDYATEFAAYLAAAAVASALGIRLEVPAEMKARLIAYWHRRGRRLFYADQPRAACANKYERQAYDLAEAELMVYIDEKDTKPGLTDYVTMAIYPGEYETLQGAGRYE